MANYTATDLSKTGLQTDSSYGNSGDFLKSNGEGAFPTWEALPASDRTLIATIDVSGASIAEFDGLFSTDYEDFELVLSNIQSTNAYGSMTITYKKSGAWLSTNYGISSASDAGGTTATGPYGAQAYGTNTDSVITLLAGGNQNLPSNDALASINGVIKISSPNTSLAHVSVFDGFFNATSSTTITEVCRYVRVVGTNLTGGVLEGIRVTTSNILGSGKIHLYGIRPTV